MADADLRKLERDALQGDDEARQKLLRELLRTKPGTWEGLVADVIARPDDDLPRLLIASWLRANGKTPRAELIEAQVALARGDTYYSVLKRSRRAQTQLLERHELEWVRPLRLSHLGNAGGTFERGFLAEVRCEGQRLLAHGEAAFAREPITRLDLHCSDPVTLAAVCAAPWFERVTSLRVRGGLGDLGAQVLADAPRLGHLRALNLGDCGIGPDGANALAASPGLTGLERLSLSGNDLGDDGVVAIASSPTFANLTALYLARTEVADDGLRALADAPHFTRLERLGLDANEDPSDGAWSALAGSPNLPSLSWLEVSSWGGPRTEALAALQARCPRLRRR